MKKTILIIAITLMSITTNAQKKWFTAYQDSVALLNNANKITEKFKKDVYKFKKDDKFTTTTILNTTPYLIFFDGENKVNIPLWSQVLPELKAFTKEVTGSEEEGKRMFGLFFNGFYLIHEYGHAYQETYDHENSKASYQNEHLANTIAMLYWRKIGKKKELKQCYELAKKMFAKLPNPVPEGISKEEYLTKNYEEATQNPFVYAYMQFGQFIEIYEDQSLPRFDEYMKSKFK
ncbi:hypothetical protein [Flavobacterium sp.]|uniref:hypothetical protein n=1 Tax=Flavobacterium sp. TaxID=239 RepID=UPI0026149C52|nr:hypothetical protein [Flavobacterium sp.]